MDARIIHGPQIQHSFDISLGEFFYTMCDKHGDKIAQIDSITDQKESFNSVKERSIRVAIEMSNRGITSKDVVVFCTVNCLDNIIPLIGATYLGAKIASLDPTLSSSHVKHILKLVEPTMIFVETKSLSLIEKAIENIENKPQIVMFGKSSQYPSLEDFTKIGKDEDKFELVKISADEVAVLFFSSGTTGLPKAISISSRSIINYTNHLRFNYNAIIHFSSLYWISGISMVVANFFYGGYRVLIPQFNVEQTFKIIEKYKVTFIFTASLLAYKLSFFKDAGKFNLSSLDTIILGGTPVTPAQLEKIQKVFKDSNVLVGYGMTETGGIAYSDPHQDRDLIPKKLESCGKLLCGITMKIVDIDTRKLLPPYQKGEICLKSCSIMAGYYNADSSDVFDSDGYLKSGDIGYYDEDDCIYVVDRIKEMFKYQSWHIVPSAIECVLLEHPAILEVCVFGIPDEIDGELPAAAVVLKDGLTATSEEIAEFVAQKVLDREKLRGGVKIVENLLKTPSGKLMRLDVKAQIIGSMKN